MSLQISGLGTLTRDAELRATTNGAWINFGIACRRKGVPDGMQDVDFFEASYFVKNAESKIMDYLKKGIPIYVDRAEMRADRYEKDGQKKTAFKLRIFTFDFLNLKRNEDKENPLAAEAKTEVPEKQPSVIDKPTEVGTTPTKDIPAPKDDAPTEEITEEEIPF